MRFLGINIGSISISAVIIDEMAVIETKHYWRHQGLPERHLRRFLEGLDLNSIRAIGITGNGGRRIAAALGSHYVSEIGAIAFALAHLNPGCRSVVEMGGHTSRYYLLDGKSLVDFSTGGLCAAGTGSFLDQQAARLKLPIEEFGRLALRSQDPPHIAGRCSVFAKSDMIHHQQIGTPDYDIVAGLCYAVARNFKGTILKSRCLYPPVLFIGGVALNAGVVRALKDELGLRNDELVVPELCLFYSAMGAALRAIHHQHNAHHLFVVPATFGEVKSVKGSAPPLRYDFPELKHYDLTNAKPKVCSSIGYLGVDVGSLSTNLVVIDPEGRVMARRYLMTEGRPIKAVQRGLKEIALELDGRVEIRGVGTTGSGRYLIGDILGADIIRNEITAQAKAAVFFDPHVDTIFEIGGQDSKYIKVDNGVVVDFEMNKACAAGTGSFLQEQAERLNISIEQQFSDLALAACGSVGCSERCTVFIESDIVAHQQSGAPLEDIVAGLAYSIVHNYLNKVVGRRKIGERIFFQGGVAWNKAVVAAFESVTGKKIIVPPHHDVTGAIGAALLAKEMAPAKTKFRGFAVADMQFVQESFVCRDCANVCTIRRVSGPGIGPLFYGSRCEKYEVDDRKAGRRNGNYPVVWRNRLMFASPRSDGGRTRGKIGLPRMLGFWTLWPFWNTFFRHLGFEVVSSAPTNSSIVRRGAEIVGAETCFPVKVAHGHILDLLGKELDYLFVPSVINMKREVEEETESYLCPYVQAIPYLAKAVLAASGQDKKMICPTIHFGHGRALLGRELRELGTLLGCSADEVSAAWQAAEQAQADFHHRLIERGRQVLQQKGVRKLVLVGRPYNTCDPGLNLDIAKKIAALGAICLPPDMLETEPLPVNDSYWHFGKMILRWAETIKKYDDVFAVYITNFGCGPDSFITHDFAEAMGDKPWLQLELDEHSADAGLITRLEAFLDSLDSATRRLRKGWAPMVLAPVNGFKRKLYIPRMSEQAFLFQAALAYCAIEAEILPESDEVTLQLGRKYTLGKECYPAVLTTGDLVKLVQSPNFDPKRSAFFMPSAGGPCRFGQYHRLHRRLLSQLGFGDVPVYSPHSGDSYGSFPGAVPGFRRLAWRAFIFGDYLSKFHRSARVRLKQPAAADELYAAGFKAGCEDVLKGGKKLAEILAEYARALTALDDGVRPKAKVGVVGEIYIRNNDFSNNRLLDKLESLGVEVCVASFIEWIDYTTYMYKYHSLLKHEYFDVAKAIVKDFMQRREVNKISASVHHLLNGNAEKPVAALIKEAQPYLSTSIGGEAILSIGRAIDLVRAGCSGIVNCLPFTCMPGNISQALSAKVSADLGGVPWLNIAYEGPNDPTETPKLEAFVEQACHWQRRRPSWLGHA